MKKIQSVKFTIGFALLLAGLVFNSGAQAQTTATLNFSGLQNNEEAREFYNGGAGSLGSTGGANYGISFVLNGNSAPSGNIETAFTTPQIRNNDRKITINVPNNFGGQITFRYTRPNDTLGDSCYVRAMSELSLGGSELGRLVLPLTGTAGGYDTAPRPLTTFTFSGTGKSLEFNCGATFMAIDDITFSPGGGTTNPALRYADFDGDARTDVAVYRRSTGVWYLNPSTAPATSSGVQFGAQNDVTVPADYDGDGKSDIAVWRGGSPAYFYILQSSNGAFRAEPFGQSGDNPTVTGDWDADGKADLAVYRGGSQSYFYYRPSAQSGVSVINIQWGTNGDTPILGDFDGDKKLDAAVYRTTDNTYYVRQSSNGAILTKQWGVAATDAIFAGDFDGDGKSDFAVQRFSGADAGTWYVAQSGGTNRAFLWGTGSDLPVPADFDGDGRTDFAVYRRANGTWYIYRSATNTAQAVTFGANSDFPLPLNLVR